MSTRPVPSPLVFVHCGGDLTWASALLGGCRPCVRSCDSPGLPQQVSLPAATVPPPAFRPSPGLPRGFVRGAQAASGEGHGLEVKAGPGARDPWSGAEAPDHPEGGTGGVCPITPCHGTPRSVSLKANPSLAGSTQVGVGSRAKTPELGARRTAQGPSGRPDCLGGSDKQSSPSEAATEPCGSHCSASMRASSLPATVLGPLPISRPGPLPHAFFPLMLMFCFGDGSRSFWKNRGLLS